MTDDPKIVLGGEEFAIPKLAIRQNRHVEPLAARHLDYFARVAADGDRVRLLDLTEPQAEDFTRIVYHAATRARPELTYAQFEQMPITMKEIMLALPVCLHQSGLFVPVAEAPQPPGEAGTPSTGTAS